MANDALIDALTQDLAPVRPVSPTSQLALLGGLGAVELVAFLLTGALRPDFVQALAGPDLWWKLASLAVPATVGITVAVRSFSPDRSAHAGLRVLTLAVAAALAIGVVLLAVQPSALPIGERLDPGHGLICVVKMVALSLPPLGAVALLARRGAPADPAATALAAGVGVATWGAFVFAFACPADDPLYIITWYLVGCGIVAAAGRTLLARLLRW